MPLCPDLKCVTQTKSKERRVGNGAQHWKTQRKGFFCNESNCQVEQTTYNELSYRKRYGLELRGVPASHDHMASPKQCAEEFNGVSRADLEPAACGKKERPHRRQHHCNNRQPINFLM